MLPPTAVAIVQPLWESVGISATGLRIFIDRASVTDKDDLRSVRVRVGSPGRIVGRIVEVRQSEEFDCMRRQWRLRAFEALDEDGATIDRSPPDPPIPAMVPIETGSIGAAVYEAVCDDRGR